MGEHWERGGKEGNTKEFEDRGVHEGKKDGKTKEQEGMGPLQERGQRRGK